jgi:hypothetical protein
MRHEIGMTQKIAKQKKYQKINENKCFKKIPKPTRSNFSYL